MLIENIDFALKNIASEHPNGYETLATKTT